MTSKITLERLSEYFQLPQKDAAREMEMSLTSLKKICRAHGITRWPFRKLMSLERSIDKIQRDTSIIESISAQKAQPSKGGSNSDSDQEPTKCSKSASGSSQSNANASHRFVAGENGQFASKDLSLALITDRTMPPPPPRVPPSGSGLEMAIGGQSAHSGPWLGNQPLAPMMPGMAQGSGSQNFMGSMAHPFGSHNGQHPNFLHGSSHHRPPGELPGDQGYSESMDQRQSFGGISTGGIPQQAIEAAASGEPSCSILPNRPQDLLICNWSMLWSLHNLRRNLLEALGGTGLRISPDGGVACLTFPTAASASFARAVCHASLSSLRDLPPP
eukprot:CAMPEP_0113689372 /NCGR_PEP_ID=MMETSP0038_2-20120614/17119_1 /TAXON_ID=2898 /ORGANISM="Cryptomonas paramecium" /LENGTH=329 /DNA_ID=CAMNT_0000610419 /DNA_START=117 /DNA_END=1102 /DNA_ORIENTATION=+ /assembly_acc=CAM_ASM_000170